MVNHKPAYYKNKLQNIENHYQILIDEVNTNNINTSNTLLATTTQVKSNIKQLKNDFDKSNKSLFMMVDELEEDTNNLNEYIKSYDHAI